MLGRLEDAGYVRRGAYKDLLLTAEGRAAADRALRKQRILECFASTRSATGSTSATSRRGRSPPGSTPTPLERVWNALGRPASCPHGWPLDSERARHESRGLLALGAVPPATPVSVERLDESNRDRLRALLDSGIAPARSSST